MAWYRAAWSGALDHLRRTTPASVHQVAYRHQLEARMAVVRGNTLESGYMLLVSHAAPLAQAEPIAVDAAAGPTRTTGESSLLCIFSISLEPSFSHGPTLANGGGIHWDILRDGINRLVVAQA